MTTRADLGLLSAAMPTASKSLVALEPQLSERLLAFERLDGAWPRGRDVIERAEIGQEREEALSEIASIQEASSLAGPTRWPTLRRRWQGKPNSAQFN